MASATALSAKVDRFDVVTGITKRLAGMCVNARPGYWDLQDQDWKWQTGDRLDRVPAKAWTAVLAPYALGVNVGVDSGSLPLPTVQSIEARQAGTAAADERYWGLWTLAHMRAVDFAAGIGAQSVALQAKAVNAANDERLYHLLSRSAVMGHDVGAGAAGVRSVPIAADTADAVADERLEALYTLAFLRALNAGGAAGSQGVALQAAAGAVVHDERLMHLLATACLYGTNSGAAVGSKDVPIEAREPGTTPLDERLYGAYSLAFVRGINSGAAAGSQGVAVEARSGGTAPSAYYGLVINSRDFVLTGLVGGDFQRVLGIGASYIAAEAEGAFGKFVLQPRESGFAAARRGKRFVSANQTPGTDVTVPVVGAFDATKPLLMLRVDSASIRAIIRALKVQLTNTPGSLVRLRLCLDTADRYSAAGTAVTPQNTNEESATAAVAKVYETPTANAAGGGTRYLHPAILNPVQGEEAEFDLEDGVLLGPTAATLLVYAWQASGTAGTLTWWMEHEEVA